MITQLNVRHFGLVCSFPDCVYVKNKQYAWPEVLGQTNRHATTKNS